MPKSFFLPSTMLIEATTTRDSSSKKLWFNPYLPGSKRSECFPEVDGQEHQERQDLYHSLTIYYIILYTHDTHLTHWQDSLHSYISLTIPLSSMIYCTYYIHIIYIFIHIIYTVYPLFIHIVYPWCLDSQSGLSSMSSMLALGVPREVQPFLVGRLPAHAAWHHWAMFGPTGRPWGRPWDVAGNFWDFRFKLLPLFAVIEKEIFVVRESSERHRGVPSRVPSRGSGLQEARWRTTNRPFQKIEEIHFLGVVPRESSGRPTWWNDLVWHGPFQVSPVVSMDLPEIQETFYSISYNELAFALGFNL